MLAGTLVYRHGHPNLMSEIMGPGLVGLCALAHLGSCAPLRVGAFLLLCLMPMLGQDTRASSKLKMDTEALDAPGSNQLFYPRHHNTQTQKAQSPHQPSSIKRIYMYYIIIYIS